MTTLCEVAERVESGLDALRELLLLANGAKVDAGGVAALLAPMLRDLGQVTRDLAEMTG